jgi:uncharacterized protein YqeY
MALIDTLNSDFKSAMKNREELRLNVLRMVKTAAKNKQVELGRELNEDDLLAVIRSQAKQRRDSIEQFRQGGREELATREEAELAFLNNYLPQQMTPEQIESNVREIVAELGVDSMKGMGQVMKEFMSRHQGQADGKQVQEAVKVILSGQ